MMPVVASPSADAGRASPSSDSGASPPSSAVSSQGRQGNKRSKGTTTSGFGDVLSGANARILGSGGSQQYTSDLPSTTQGTSDATGPPTTVANADKGAGNPNARIPAMSLEGAEQSSMVGSQPNPAKQPSVNNGQQPAAGTPSSAVQAPSSDPIPAPALPQATSHTQDTPAAALSTYAAKPATAAGAIDKVNGEETDSAADYGKESSNTPAGTTASAQGDGLALLPVDHNSDMKQGIGSVNPEKTAASSRAATPATAAGNPSWTSGVNSSVAGPVATPLASAAPAVPVAEQMTRAVVSQEATLRQQGSAVVHLQLDPPGLGAVRIQLSATGPAVNARVVVQGENTQALLQSQAHDLRDRLTQAGVTLGRFDVSCDSGESQQGWQQPPPRQSVTGAGLAQVAPASTRMVAGTQRTSEGIIDVVA